MNPTTDSSQGERLLTKEDVAKRLGVRPRTVGVWVQQGRLRAYHVGRYLRFKSAQVEEFLAAECQSPGASTAAGKTKASSKQP